MPSTRFAQRPAKVSVVLISCVFSSVSAQTAPQRIEKIEVVSTSPLAGIGVPKENLPYDVQTVRASDIERAQTSNLTDFMTGGLTGVNANNVQGSPYQSDVMFRGFRASPTLGSAQGISVYLDSVRINEAFADIVTWDMVPEAAISQVMMVPGSNPIFGLNTLGGALVLSTKSGRDSQGLSVDATSGRFGRTRADVTYGYKTNSGWHGFLAGTAFAEKGWRDYSRGRIGNLFGKFGKDGAGYDWNVTVLHGESRLRGNGLLPSYRLSDGVVESGLYESNRQGVYTHPDITRNKVSQATLSGTLHIDAGSELSAALYHRNSKRSTSNGDLSEDYGSYVESCEGGFLASGQPSEPDECPFTRDEGAAIESGTFNGTETKQRASGVQVNYAFQNRQHTLNVGAAFDQTRVTFSQTEQEGFVDATRGINAEEGEEPELDSAVRGKSQAVGIYATDTWKIAPTTHVTLAGRFNHVAVDNTLVNDSVGEQREKFSYRKFNPAIGLAHGVADTGLTFFGGWSQSNRTPTVIELGCANPENPCRLPVGLQDDPYLAQVVAQTVEFGARYRPTANTSLVASIYRTQNKDDIIFLRAAQSQFGYFANFERTLRQGVDLSATYRLGNAYLRASYSYLRATYDAEGKVAQGERTIDVRPGMRLPGLPLHTFKLAADWQVTPMWSLGLDVVGNSSLVTQGNEDGLLTNAKDGDEAIAGDWKIKGHALLHLRTRYKLSPNVEFYARVNNLANKRYETYGALGNDYFPAGQLIAPHVAPGEAAVARFVAPGAPRAFFAGVRVRL